LPMHLHLARRQSAGSRNDPPKSIIEDAAYPGPRAKPSLKSSFRYIALATASYQGPRLLLIQPWVVRIVGRIQSGLNLIVAPPLGPHLPDYILIIVL
jgi:hypothetical protein